MGHQEEQEKVTEGNMFKVHNVYVWDCIFCSKDALKRCERNQV